MFGVSPSSEPVSELRLIDEQGLSKNINIITEWLHEFIFTGDLLYYLDDVPSGDDNDDYDNVHVKIESSNINPEETGPGDAHDDDDNDGDGDDDDDDVACKSNNEECNKCFDSKSMNNDIGNKGTKGTYITYYSYVVSHLNTVNKSIVSIGRFEGQNSTPKSDFCPS